MAAVIDDEKRVCTHCGRNQPPDRFKRRSRAQGRRLSWCRDCINAAARERTAKRRAEILGYAAKYVRLESPASKVECVVAAACRRLGGIEAFAENLAAAVRSSNPTRSLSAATFLLKLLATHARLQK